ncbi:MAG: mechanosensitive ion channel domain-containing protein, partial [Aeromonas sobria]
VTGVITEIGLFYLRVRDDNGDLVTYPANLILQKPVRKLEGKLAEPLQPD